MSELKLITGRDTLREKPEPVYVLLSAWITKMSLPEAEPDLEVWCRKVLVWWDEVMENQDQYVAEPVDEVTLALVLLKHLKEKSPFWSKTFKDDLDRLLP